MISNTVATLLVSEGEFSTQFHSKSFPFWKEITINVAIYSCYALRIYSEGAELEVPSLLVTEHICLVSAAVALVMELHF